MVANEEVRLSELVACLALATDLGMGQPLEHCLRTCLLAVRVGERLGLPAEQLADAYYVSLLRFAGCSSHAHQDSVETGDEIAFRAAVAPILGGGTPEMLRFTITGLGKGSGALERTRMVAGALAAGSKGAREAIATTCEAARMVATRLGLGEGVVHALDYTYEHHDGKGLPVGSAGEEIPVSAHLAMVARDFEVLYRLGGREMVLEVAARRRGRAYEPAVLDGFVEHAWEVLERAGDEPGWDAVVAADPAPRVLDGAQLDEALRCLADFSDIRSPYTHGYSHAVANLVARAAASGDVPGQKDIGAAALVQELGMTGVSNRVLEKKGPLTEGDWERVRLHPYLTERILARCPGLAPLGALAATHHERPDGGGYHRGLSGSQLTPAGRLLGAAGAYVAMTAGRPWRPALSSREAAGALRDGVAAGRFDADAVDAVLGAAGEPVAPRRKVWPAALTDREVEVLQLISQGRTNRQVAGALVISVKTVGRHIENIYAKIGVSTRAGAAMFALQHGLTPPDPGNGY